jgi:phosphonatase-like hydrolase
VIKLVAFDMAGTTIDEHGDVYAALSRCVEESGVPTAPEAVQRWMGADKREAIAALLVRGCGSAAPETVDAAFDRFREILASLYAENPPVALPGVEEALQELTIRGVKVALTTGFSRDVAEPLLKSLGWADAGFIDAVVCSEEVALGRPAPFMIHRAMELTGVLSVTEVLAAGDTVNDLLAGTNAGVVTVGVLTGKLTRSDLEAHPHHHILGSVADVPALLERMSAQA